MNTEEQSTTATENMTTISNRLRELSNLINTVHLGLMGEDTEQQVLDCIMCFLYSVNEIHEFTERALKEIHGAEDGHSNESMNSYSCFCFMASTIMRIADT